MANKDILEKDSKYVAHTYQRFPVALKAGHGSTSYDFHGKEYIDFGSGIGTNALGFCNEQWLGAVIAQAEQIQHTSNLFCTMPAVLLAERLCEITGYKKVFFGNSGAEANEGAIKVARKYSMEKKGKNAIVLLPLKILFMEERLQRYLPQGRIFFIMTFSRLQRDFSIFRQMTVRHCRKLWMIQYVQL